MLTEVLAKKAGVAGVTLKISKANVAAKVGLGTSKSSRVMAQSLGLRVWGLGFGVWGLGFGV